MNQEVTFIKRGDALILVDVQNDFLPGGHLAVAYSDKVIPILNRYIKLFAQQRFAIFASRDWHPIDHCSFITQGRCLASTLFAEYSVSRTFCKFGFA